MERDMFPVKENFEDMEQKERQAFGKLILKKWTYIRDSWMKALKKHKDQKQVAHRPNLQDFIYIMSRCHS
ncbi:unnamed protein product [Acanthoscelides obtectus]|uniref:Uncharacterized protein n=1 Tax=Acanthoscelides obtectus TaxID=200917 RepID=A0A9P0QJN7_ACAOB|nr:unnamed protein product [Acanthoscelides obtectus]CAK1686744.1 hypothetical protein AOBTE_LOCUS36052 [Acanthoscelides obtectus]